MPDSVTVRTNLPDFRRQMTELGLRVERRLTARGVRAAGAVYRERARFLAPVLKQPRRDRIARVLQRAIFVGRSKFRAQRGVVEYYVGVRSGRTAAASKVGTARDPFYWRFLEGGWLARGPGRKFKGGERSRALQRHRALQAGAQRVRYPFLQAAFEQVSPQALQAFVQTMEQGIAQEARDVR